MIHISNIMKDSESYRLKAVTKKGDTIELEEELTEEQKQQEEIERLITATNNAFICVKNNKLPELEELLDNGVDVNAIDDNKISLLMAAGQQNLKSISLEKMSFYARQSTESGDFSIKIPHEQEQVFFFEDGDIFFFFFLSKFNLGILR